MRNDANFDLVLKLINIMIKVVFSIIDCFINSSRRNGRQRQTLRNSSKSESRFHVLPSPGKKNQPLFARKFKRLVGQRAVFARGPLIHLIIITENLFDYVMFIWEIFNLLAYYCISNLPVNILRMRNC